MNEPGQRVDTAMRGLLRSLFDAALRMADAADRLPPMLPPVPATGRIVVVGAGKAAAVMAMAAARRYGDRVGGVVVTRHGHGLRAGESAAMIRVLEAAHPAPSDDAVRAADAILAQVAGLDDTDIVVCLFSGGGSALLEKPIDALSFADLRRINIALLAGGAPIKKINVVRKHLSLIKGGRLAVAAWPARVCAFAVSDVPGDDPSTIASGPTVADPSSCADALRIIRRYGVAIPDSLEAALEDGRWETPKPGDPRLARSTFQLLATPRDALAAATTMAREGGFEVIDLGTDVEGEAADVAARHARFAVAAAERGARAIILSGGELTVTHDGGGTGGPNREYALALAIALRGQAGVWAIAADTDGADGFPDAAGAVVTPDTLARARGLGLDPERALKIHDSGPIFRALGDDVVTGPTRANVADFRAIIVAPASPYPAMSRE